MKENKDKILPFLTLGIGIGLVIIGIILIVV